MEAFDFDMGLVEALPQLRRYALALTRNRSDADDLVHTTMERALRKRQLYEPSGSFIAWLSMIMRRCHIDGVRRSRIVPMVSREDEESPSEPEAPATQFDALYLKEITAEVAALAPNFRHMMNIIVADGLTYEEAAKQLDLPLGTVRSRLFRARDALRSRIGTEG